MRQLELDIDPIPVFKVACRVRGEMQVYEVEAMSPEMAILFVQELLPHASPVIATKK